MIALLARLIRRARQTPETPRERFDRLDAEYRARRARWRAAARMSLALRKLPGPPPPVEPVDLQDMIIRQERP